MQQKNVSFYELLYGKRKTRTKPWLNEWIMGLLVKANRRDLVTHLMPTFKGAAVLDAAHPLLYNPT